MAQRPDAKSIGAYSGAELVGVAILGPSIGLPQASSCWLFSDSAEAFTRLLDRLRQLRVGPLKLLSRERIAELTIHDEMSHLFGRIDNIPDGFPYYGVVRENTLVAVAESSVRDPEVATIQQVFTLSSARRQGLGRAVVQHVAQDLLNNGIVATYFTEESNSASVSLAEDVGFELDSRWGFTELD